MKTVYYDREPTLLHSLGRKKHLIYWSLCLIALSFLLEWSGMYLNARTLDVHRGVMPVSIQAEGETLLSTARWHVADKPESLPLFVLIDRIKYDFRWMAELPRPMQEAAKYLFFDNTDLRKEFGYMSIGDALQWGSRAVRLPLLIFLIVFLVPSALYVKYITLRRQD